MDVLGVSNSSVNTSFDSSRSSAPCDGPPPKKPRTENKPRYAVITLPPDADVGSTFQSLMEVGFTSVSFATNLLELEEVQKEIELEKKKSNQPENGSSNKELSPNENSSTSKQYGSIAQSDLIASESSPQEEELLDGSRMQTPARVESCSATTSVSAKEREAEPVTSTEAGVSAGAPVTVVGNTSSQQTGGITQRKGFTTFRDRMKARIELKNSDDDIFALSIVKGVPLARTPGAIKEPKQEPIDAKEPLLASKEPKPEPVDAGEVSGVATNSSGQRYVFKKLNAPTRHTATTAAVHAPRPFPRLMDARLERAVPTRAAPPAIMPSNSQSLSSIIVPRAELPPHEKPPPPVRTPGLIYRKDYKNPPLPLPADDGTHVKCHLCDNRIMVSRLSNLTNHVRRHSAVKQYQCVHCNYQHNEQAKVRLHMTNNHQDPTSMPQDNLNKDMQKMWSMLMEECFPGYLDQLKPTALEWDKQGIIKSRLDYGTASLDELHSCTDCGDAIATTPGLPGGTCAEPLVDHMKEKHLDLCVAQKCSECGYINAEQWKVRWHISARHSEKALEATVIQEPAGKHMDLFLYKFFPSIEKVLGKRTDKEEEALNAAVEKEKKSGLREDGFQKPPVLSEQEPESSFLSNIIRATDSPDQYDEISFNEPKVDRSLLGPDVILCELCNKILDFSNKNSLCSLLAHAKRHFKIKQFECPRCPYASSEAAHVRTHLLSKHDTMERPREHNNDYMQTSWLRVMKQCFPELTDRIDSFKFKSGKSYVPEEESANNVPPVHNYSTRRKRSFFC